MQKYIDILWISYWLSLDEIKKAYLEKAMEYHPDRNHGFKKEAEEKMKEINSAWDYIREHFSEYQRMNVHKAGWNGNGFSKNNSNTQANWALFNAVIIATWLVTWLFASSTTTNVFYDIYAFFHYYFDWFVMRILWNSYILSVGLLLWAGFSLSKNKTWKRIVTWLIVLNLLIITYKLERLSEANDATTYHPIQQRVETYQKSTWKDLSKTTAPRLVKKTKDSIVLEWDAVPGATAYVVKYSKSSVALSKDQYAQYDNKTDNITATGVIITNLSSTNEKLIPNTTYYFSIVTINTFGFESSVFGDELSVTTPEDSDQKDSNIVYEVTGSNMAPKFINWTKVLVNRNIYNSENPKFWDTIIFNPNVSSWKKYISRIIGLPWENIKIEKWFVYLKKEYSNEYINLDEDYLSFNKGKTFLPLDIKETEFSIPEGQYFVMGDNRNNSLDSRNCFMSCTIKDSVHFVKMEDIIWRIESVIQ